MSGHPRFITDASLGKLAKWLRLLGYDTIVFDSQAGRPMLRQADAEERIVLTRRQDMQARQFSGILHIVTGLDIGSQLNEIIGRFSLQINKQKMFAICLKCNAQLLPVAKEKVGDSVPPYVFANCNEYNECPVCHSIYWTGTHQRNSLEYLDKLIGINRD